MEGTRPAAGTTTLRHIVPPGQDGWRLRTVLLKGMGLSRKLLIRQRNLEGSITVNGRPLFLNQPVRANDVIEVVLPPETSESIVPQPIPVDVLAEDEHLLIVNKPAGIVVHPTKGHAANTLANGIVHYWNERGESYRFRPIHRLDQDTSGVLAVAKNGYAHQFISAQFQEGAVWKEYLAVVHFCIERDEGVIDGPIERHPETRHIRIVTPTGAPSRTHYEVVERFEDATLVRVRPITGRTHQIRVHMKHIGHPLIGDELYGLKTERTKKIADVPPIRRQALHAAALSFIHPGTKERVKYEAPLPGDFQQLLQYLRNKGGNAL